ncbi:MAG: prepilin-type N-terminal cleavage/methylation domain-containing protein [Planctomycetota bacterium]|nr:MAG: prepilin-type N-terminal cleavage/methylation domain-containing protein [Planctomycetota bacterium]
MQRPIRNSRPTRPSATRSALRRAFSLIELMVVILIITILMGFLLVAVRGAVIRARVTAVVVEFKNIEKAITDFKAKYGSEPPSGIVLFEASAGWGGSSPSAAAVNRSRALIRQMWPDFDFTIARDINNDGDFTDIITLNGAECLVFFLGGMPDQTGVSDTPWALTGFSQNPLNPLALGGARSGPFYEFDSGRLMNVEGTSDAEFMPEYRDSLSGQRNPILYASSYGGRGYRDADVQFTSQSPYDAYTTTPTGFAYAYRRYTGSYPATAPNFTASPLFNAKSFQLISPGMDGEYGWGGVLSGDMELLEPRPERAFERDNITNFKGGTIN